MLCLASASAVENLLPNPSFELRAFAGVEGWNFRAWSGGAEAKYEVVAPGRSGGHAISIQSSTGSDAAWTSKVAVKAGAAYELSGWIKADAVKGAAGALINIQNMQSVKTPAVTGTSDWRQVRVVFKADKDELEINCLFGGWGKATGAAWYDDVVLREISREEFVRERTTGEELRGLNGLVAAPVMTNAKGLPRRLMGVGVDDRGKVFVSETVRVSNEEISLLQSKFLHEADMALMTVEAKEAWIRANFSQRIAKAQGVQDYNKDGAVDVNDVTVRSERIFSLNDADKDGVFDAATLFADGFNGITTGVAHSVTPIGDSVYATIIPDLWKLRDTDGDGRADVREQLVHGFANHIGYGNHDLHSVVRGYDGKIYWSMGDRGLNVASKEGKRWAYPNTGAILRCNPDGSEFEVFASGLRNCQYFDFDDFGNLFAIDHDADFQGEMERLVFIPERSDSGWRNYYQYRQVNRVLGDSAKDLYNPWLAEVMWKPQHSGQPSHFLPPIENSWNAPASFSWQPGLALGGKYRGHFLLGGMGAIRAFKMVPDGPGFRREGEDVVVDGLGQQVLASAFAPNGSLYFVLWDPPQARAPLWSLRDPSQHASELETLLAQGFGMHTDEALARMLGHDDRRVRFAAQDELSARGDTAAFKRVVLNENAPQLARIHALWGLTQLRRWDDDVVQNVVKSNDDEMQAQLARYAGDAGNGAAAHELAAALLHHRSPRVRMLASISCGKLRATSATPALLAMLRDAPDTPLLREAGIIGLTGTASATELEKLASDPSEAVRIAAVVALRRLGAAKELISFLNDGSPQVVSDAVLGIYDTADAVTFKVAPEALEAVARKLSPSSPAPINVRAIAANRRIGTPAALDRLVAFLKAPTNAQLRERIMAMDVLASWSNAATLDPVDGRYFPLPALSAEDFQSAFAPHIRTLADDRDLVIAERAVAVAARLNATDELIAHATATILDESVPMPVRHAWFELLRKQRPERADEVATQTLALTHSGMSMAAANHLLDRKLKTGEVTEYVTRTLNTRSDVVQLQGALGILKRLPESDTVLRGMIESMRAGKVAAAIQLDVIEAARFASARDKELAAAVAAYDEWAKSQKPFGEYTVALEGGNSERGKSLFLGHTAAMCSKCHALKQAGQQVGPSLEGVATRLTRADLLESVLDPGAKVAPGYGVQVLELNDGTTITGTQMSETPEAIVLKSPDGKLVTHPKARIKSATKPVGAMPPMKGLLTLREMRDLVAFLSTLTSAN
jgi:putative membrane-bound dehydrogenase-like protein